MSSSSRSLSNNNSISIKTSPQLTPKPSKVKSLNVETSTPDTITPMMELRHPIYGLLAYMNDSIDELSMLDKKVFIYELHQFVDKWCMVNGINKTNITSTDHRNCIYSFIMTIIKDPIGDVKDLNRDSFKPIIGNSQSSKLNMFDLVDKIFNDSGFENDED